jgi:hypothetical protein
MKRVIYNCTGCILFSAAIMGCKKDAAENTTTGSSGIVKGKITDAAGHPLSGVKVTIEHTVWYNNYVYAQTNSNGEYTAKLPAEPAGDWTAKAQVEKEAYGQTYHFDLAPSSADPFNKSGAVRNFTWKISGKRPGDNGYYGAHADLYAFGADVDMTNVKLVFTPVDNTLIDGSSATTIERSVQDVAGTFMATDIPVGKYTVKAVYPGKTLLLQNRHDDNGPAVSKEVVFGKNGFLGETEYNIEFWVSEE